MRTLSTLILAATLLLVACQFGLTPEGTPGPDDPKDPDSATPGDSDLPGDSEPTVPDNEPPVADAGEDQVVVIDTVVNLDGWGSVDPEGEELAYAWELDSMPSGSGVTIVNPEFAGPMFIPDQAGAYVISLVVDDGELASAPDTVLVTAEGPGELPVADAGYGQSVTTGDTVRLDGSGSYDPGGESLTYAWSFRMLPSASNATISNPSSVSPSFVADVQGTFEVNLVVSDSTSSSDPDTASIIALDEDEGDDCGFGCAREAQIAIEKRLGGTALVIFPLLFGWRWRRRPTG